MSDNNVHTKINLTQVHHCSIHNGAVKHCATDLRAISLSTLSSKPLVVQGKAAFSCLCAETLYISFFGLILIEAAFGVLI